MQFLPRCALAHIARIRLLRQILVLPRFGRLRDERDYGLLSRT
jgi:hypothetical protein